MPTAPIDLDTDTYLSAGDLFLEVDDTLCDVVAAAATCASGGGGMAGTDSSGADWSTTYDEAARTGLATGATLVDCLAGGLDADGLRQWVQAALNALGG